VLRANQFLSWVDDGGYEQVLKAPDVVPLLLPEGVKRFCSRCGYGLAGPEAFCPGCGQSVAALA
jgi:rubrerythrin